MKIPDKSFGGSTAQFASSSPQPAVMDRPRHDVFDVKDAPKYNSFLPGRNEVKKATEEATKLASVFNRSLKFEYKEEAGVMQVTVTDTDKDEVIRKIPSDEMVRFVERVKEMLGATFDEFL